MKQALHFLYRFAGCVVGAWILGAIGIVIGLFLLGGTDSTLADLGLSISGEGFILLAIGSAASGLGGAIGFKHPSYMSGANGATF